MEQANNLFGALEWNEEVKLLDWLDYFYRRENCNSIRKNDIRKYGPNSLRRGKRLDVVLQRLEREGCIDIEQCERQSLWVCQGPTFLTIVIQKNSGSGIDPAISAISSKNSRVKKKIGQK